MNDVTEKYEADRDIAESAAEHNKMGYAQVYAQLSNAAAIEHVAEVLEDEDDESNAKDRPDHPKPRAAG
ncbi:hypothetical protein [Amycolatopsis sp. NPDC054798]